VAKTITIIASALIFTVLGLITGVALNWFRHTADNYNSEFAVMGMVCPTLGGALFGAAVGAFAVMMGSSK
jgi:hypothetical protein